MQSQDDVYGLEDALYCQVVKYFFLMTGISFSYGDSFASESFVWRADHFLEEAIEEKKIGGRYYESDDAVLRLRCAGAAFCLGFAFSMLCLSACIRSIICARCGASGGVTVISPPLLFSSNIA